MKIIWSVVGVLIIIILIAVIYRNTQRSRNIIVSPAAPITPTPAPVPTPVVTRQVEQVVITPVIFPYNTDCRTQAYRDNLDALWVTYNQKRTAYQNEIATSGPNAITLYREMNVAYNDWYRERRKCLLIA